MKATTNPIWLKWVDQFLGSNTSKQVSPMTSDEASMFMSMVLAEMKPDPAQSRNINMAMEMFTPKIIASRLELLGAKASKPVIVFLGILSPSPGIAVMWAHALTRLHQIHGVEVTTDHLAKAFPVGFPTGATLNDLWDKQKGIGGARDNFLDTVTA